MERCVALIRGINVGGRNTVAMADLRRVFVASGHREVRTYVQSGNVVFTPARDDVAAVGSDLGTRIHAELGVAVTIMLRTAGELARVVADNPFAVQAAADPTKVHAAFLSAEPTDPSVLALADPRYAPEQIASGDRVRYLLLPGGMGRSRLAADLTRRDVGVQLTLRNWRTVTRLFAMARAGAGRPSSA